MLPKNEKLDIFNLKEELNLETFVDISSIILWFTHKILEEIESVLTDSMLGNLRVNNQTIGKLTQIIRASNPNKDLQKTHNKFG